MDDATIEGEVVEETIITADDEQPQAQTLPVKREMMRPIANAEEATKFAVEHQELLRAVLDESDYQTAERGRKFVKKSGWRKIATHYGLTLTIQSMEVERDEEGHAVRATVIARAVAPNGQTQDGDGYCSIEESRFANGRGRQKLENDLRATATTRAKNRAISDLVGMGEVSAEEIAAFGTHDTGQAEPEFNGNIDEIIEQISSLTNLDDAEKLIAWVKKEHDGKIPMSVGRALQATARLLSTRHVCESAA